MLQGYLHQLCEELAIAPAKLKERGFFSLQIGEHLLSFKDLDPGFSVQASLCSLPEKKREDLFLYLMRANLFGQGTGGSRIGIDANEKFLTLSLGLPYELDYPVFRTNIEDFVNYLIYWREEIAKFENEKSVY